MTVKGRIPLIAYQRGSNVGHSCAEHASPLLLLLGVSREEFTNRRRTIRAVQWSVEGISRRGTRRDVLKISFPLEESAIV
jgi:hypothetical protein